MKRQGKIKMKVIDVINEKTPEEMQQIISETITKIQDPLSQQYQTQKQSIITCLQQIDKLLIPETEYKQRKPLMTFEEIEMKEKEYQQIQQEYNEYSKTMSTEFQKKKESIQQLQTELQSITTQQQEKQKIYEMKENELSTISVFTEDDLKKKQIECEKKQKDAQSMKMKYDEIMLKLEVKKNENESLKQERITLENSIKEKEERKNEFKRKLNELEKEERKLRNEYELKRKEIENINVQNEHQIRIMEQEVESLKEKIIEYSNTLGEQPDLYLEDENNDNENDVEPIYYDLDDDDLLF